MGETRLADEFAAGVRPAAERRSCGGGVGKVVALLRSGRGCRFCGRALRTPATATILSRLGPAAADLAALLPEFRARTGEPDSTLTPSPIAPLTTSGPDEFEQARFRLFSSTVDFSQTVRGARASWSLSSTTVTLPTTTPCCCSISSPAISARPR